MPEKQAEDEWKNEIDHALAAPRMMDALYPRWNKHILGDWPILMGGEPTKRKWNANNG